MARITGIKARVAAAVLFAGVCVCGSAAAVDFGRDDNGNVKFTVKSIPFFDDEKEGEEQYESRSSSDYDDEEYAIDSIGRRVPVRTHRSGSAISTP